MIINKVKFPRKDKNMQLNNNQNQTKILNLQSWNLNLEEKLELILKFSINNQQFVCREKKKLEAKTRENYGCSRPWELCYEAATRLIFIEKTRLNLLTSHFLVKLGFLDSNL